MHLNILIIWYSRWKNCCHSLSRSLVDHFLFSTLKFYKLEKVCMIGQKKKNTHHWSICHLKKNSFLIFKYSTATINTRATKWQQISSNQPTKKKVYFTDKKNIQISNFKPNQTTKMTLFKRKIIIIIIITRRID